MKALVFFLINFIFTSFIFSQKEIAYKHFEFDDEYSDASVYGIVDDEYGQLYIATSEGLFKFSSNNYEKIPTANARDNEVFKLTRHGNAIYCNNLSGQIGEVKNDTLFFHDLYYNNERVISLTNSYNSDIDKSFTLIDGKCYNISKSFELNIISILDTSIVSIEFSNETPIYISINGECLIRKEDSSHLLIDLKIPRNFGYFFYKLNDDLFILYSKNESLWYEVRLDKNLNTKIKEHKSIFPLIYSPYYDLKSKLLFLSTPNGVYTYDTYGDTLKAKEVYIENKDILCSYKDKYDNIWFGTKQIGLFQLPKDKFLKLSNQEIIGQKINYLKGGNKRLYIGGIDGTIYTYTKEGLNFGFKPRVKDYIRQVYEKENGFRVISDINIVEYNDINKKWYEFPMVPGIKKEIPFNDSIDIIVLGHASVLNFNYTDIVADTVFFEGRVTSTLLNDSGIFLGTYSGTLHYFNVLTRSLKEIKLKNSDVIINNPINSLIIDNKKNLWLSVENKGIFYIKEDSLVQYKATKNFTNPKKMVFYKNHLWASSEKGLVHCNLSTSQVEVFNKYNSLNRNNVVDITIYDDYLWLTDSREIFTIKADKKVNKQYFPSFNGNSLIVNGEKINEEEILITTKDPVVIKYQLIYHNTFPNNQIAYRYNQFDTNWIVTNDNPLVISGFKPGKYIIELASVNELGEISNAKVKLKINVRQTFWNTPWFYIIILSFMMILVVLVMKRREKKRLKIKDEELQKVSLLRELNELKMKSLQSQMNPHFIFNALNSIQSLLFDENPKLAVLFLSKFAKLVRGIFDNSDKYQITIEDEISFLENYIKLEELRFEGIESQISCNIDKGIKIPPLIIQPIVENSFKHGFFHKKGKKKLTLNFTQENGFVVVEIIDNGIGREKVSQIRGSNSVNYHASSSLKIVKERLKIYNKIEGEFFELKDLKSKLGDSQGTKTVIKFKINP